MILVCYHKESKVFVSDIHIPIQVGAALTPMRMDMLHDNDGDNISDMNQSYCELTALYWAWKNGNSDDELWGLEHYRRFFSNDTLFGSSLIYKKEDDFRPLQESKLKSILDKYDIVLSKPETLPIRLFDDYAMKHERKDIDALRSVIEELYPQSVASFDYVMKGNNKLSPYNMFVTKREVLDEYCSWLFAILFELQRRLDISTYSMYQQRIYGFMAERLLNVFVHYKQLNVRYLPTAYIGEKPSLAYRVGKSIVKEIDRLRFWLISLK